MAINKYITPSYYAFTGQKTMFSIDPLPLGKWIEILVTGSHASNDFSKTMLTMPVKPGKDMHIAIKNACLDNKLHENTASIEEQPGINPFFNQSTMYKESPEHGFIIQYKAPWEQNIIPEKTNLSTEKYSLQMIKTHDLTDTRTKKNFKEMLKDFKEEKTLESIARYATDKINIVRTEPRPTKGIMGKITERYNNCEIRLGTEESRTAFITAIFNALGIPLRKIKGATTEALGNKETIIDYSWHEVFIPINKMQGFWALFDHRRELYGSYPSTKPGYGVTAQLPLKPGKAQIKLEYV